jgi:hypothetical protein
VDARADSSLNSDIERISPCGICRQLLREFCPLNVRELPNYGRSALIRRLPLKVPIYLVPASFGPDTPVVPLSKAADCGLESFVIETTMGEVSHHCVALFIDH